MTLVWWQCPICNNLDRYTVAQAKNRKRCPRCAAKVNKVRQIERRGEARLIARSAGRLCTSCGRRFRPPPDGRPPLRCPKCREPKV